MKEPEKVRNHGGGKEEIPIESIQLIIEFIAYGYLLDDAIEMTKNKGFPGCHNTNFNRLVRKYNLEEDYHDAFQTRKLIYEERLLKEVDKIKPRIASEYTYIKSDEGYAKRTPSKYIANTAEVQKFELKRKLIASMEGRNKRFRIMEGSKVEEQIESIKNAMATREISTIEAMNVLNVLDKEITLTKFEALKSELADAQFRIKQMEIRGGR